MKMFGEYIRSMREAQNLPLRKVAAFLDIDTSILSKIERGERNINLDLVNKISEYFNLDKSKLHEEYLSEQVAKTIYKEENIESILKVAEKKANYLRSINQEQSKLNFNE